MNGRTLNVVLASSFGAGIGSLVAIELFHALWMVGLLVGLVVGFLSCEWREVVAAVPVAWRAAKGWRPPPSFGKACKADMLYVPVSASWFSLLLFALFLVIRPAESRTGHWQLTVLLYAHAGGIVASVILMIWNVVDNALFKTEESLAFQARHLDHLGAKGILAMSAPYVLFWLLPQALPATLVATFHFALTFGWQLFLAIFSKARLTSAVASLIGSGIGFLCGSVLAGMFSGAVLGFLGHAVILRLWLIPRGYVTVPAKID